MVSQKGKGYIQCELVGKSTKITKISHDYPLRLMKPKSHSNDHQAVYLLSYGGGLLSGDVIELQVIVESGCMLSIHSQASTKVYKSLNNKEATQTMNAKVVGTALLAVLPEPVTCFAHSSFVQYQDFYLDASSSLILLDWFTSGRTSRGECWQFDRLHTENRIYIENELVIRDAWGLDQSIGSLDQRMHPFQCVANVVLIGDKVSDAMASARESDKEQIVYKNNNTKVVPLIWSLSNLQHGDKTIGVIIRAASLDTILMRQFLLKLLASIPSSVLDYFSRI
jgi:urease accessory protein